MSVLISVFRPCMTQNGYAILRLLSSLHSMSFTQCLQCLQISRTALKYYVKQFRKYGVINTDRVTKLYFLTPYGKKILDAIDSTFPEKFLTNDLDEICINTESGEHSFTKLDNKIVCRFCAFVRQGKEILQ